MGAQSNAIGSIFASSRKELGRNIRELNALVRAEPKRGLQENLARIAAAAFGAFLLIGFVITSRRHKGY